MRALITKNPSNAKRIFPYIGGEEVNTSPNHAHSRFVIDFENFPLKRDKSLVSWGLADSQERKAWLRKGVVPADYPLPTASDWPDLIDVVERLVKPKRKDADTLPWWQFLRPRWELRRAICDIQYVYAISRVTEHLCFARLQTGSVFADRLVVMASDNFAFFSTVQSRLHEQWARAFSPTMEDRLLYAPSDCFYTFPFPLDFETSPALEAVGHTYNTRRAALMLARNEGMTKTYNRFHDPAEQSPDIVALRDLHADMDRAVLRAYAACASTPEDAAAWNDLADRAEAVFLDETNEDDHTYQGRLFWPSAFRDEVLARLLALNAERAAAERAAGLAPITVGAESGEVEDLDA